MRGQRLARWLLGAPRDLKDARIFHSLSLVAVLAWIGLGADALSSSAYGPEEAFKALRGHEHLALPLAIATALTVFLIAGAYSKAVGGCRKLGVSGGVNEAAAKQSMEDLKSYVRHHLLGG